MKKIFTLLALLVAVVTGAQAAVTPLTTKKITETTLIYTSKANLEGLGYAQDGKGTQTYSPAGSDRGAGMDPTDETSSDFEIGTNAVCLKGAESNKEVLMYVTNVAQVDAYVKNNGGDGRALTITATPASGNPVSVTATSDQSLKGYSGRISLELDASQSYTISFTSPAGDIFLYAVRLVAQAADAPVINASSVNIMATESGVPAKEVIDVSGANLAGSTLTATFSPAVDGLTVNLASSDITDGEIETTATIYYTATENVEESTTTLILSDGTTTREVTITYSALVVLYEQESISDATTWDFADVTGTVQYGKEGQEPKEERLYANVTELTYKSTFNAKALTFEGEYAARGGYAQNGTLRFNTTVPGTVEVTFSNTGGSNNDRYCQVNGVTGSVEAVGTAKNTEEFEVAAGDVVITGVAGTEGGNTALRFFKIVFTPSEEPVGVTAEVTFNKYGLGTFYYSDNAFVIPEGVIAATYALNADNTKVQPNMTIEAGGMIAAGVPVVIKGEPNTTYYFNEALDAANAIQDPDNILIGQENAGLIEANPTAEFYYYTLGAKSGVCGFYWGAADGGVFELGAHKAYLALAADVASNASFVMFDGTVTAINAIQNNEAVAKGAIYNLNGQKVNTQYKGVVIVNGKKQIRK